MQSRSARTLQAELHGSSGAKKRRHQDDKATRCREWLAGGSVLGPCALQSDTFAAQATESWIRGKSEVAAIDAQKPVAAPLGDHHPKVVTLHAVGTTNIIGLSQTRPLNHGATALSGSGTFATEFQASDSGQVPFPA
jgi:hypothetical protein